MEENCSRHLVKSTRSGAPRVLVPIGERRRKNGGLANPLVAGSISRALHGGSR